MIYVDLYLLLGVAIVGLLAVTRRDGGDREKSLRRELELAPPVVVMAAQAFVLCLMTAAWPIAVVVRLYSRLVKPL